MARRSCQACPQQTRRWSQTSVSPHASCPHRTVPEAQSANVHTKEEDHADAVFHIAQYRTRYVTARPPTAQSLSPTHPANSLLPIFLISLHPVASAQWTNPCRRPNRPVPHLSLHTARPMPPHRLCDTHRLSPRRAATPLRNSTRAPRPRPSAPHPSVTPLPTLRPRGTAVLPRQAAAPARLKTAKTVARARLVTAKKRECSPLPEIPGGLLRPTTGTPVSAINFPPLTS